MGRNGTVDFFGLFWGFDVELIVFRGVNRMVTACVHLSFTLSSVFPSLVLHTDLLCFSRALLCV